MKETQSQLVIQYLPKELKSGKGYFDGAIGLVKDLDDEFRSFCEYCYVGEDAWPKFLYEKGLTEGEVLIRLTKFQLNPWLNFQHSKAYFRNEVTKVIPKYLKPLQLNKFFLEKRFPEWDFRSEPLLKDLL